MAARYFDQGILLRAALWRSESQRRTPGLSRRRLANLLMGAGSVVVEAAVRDEILRLHRDRTTQLAQEMRARLSRDHTRSQCLLMRKATTARCFHSEGRKFERVQRRKVTAKIPQKGWHLFASPRAGAGVTHPSRQGTLSMARQA